jgi:antitoxin component of RelBE/YafQ-DinJ toxin-antitoxin module
MTYISNDTNKKQAQQFLEYVKTLPFAKIHDEPNPVTLKAMEDAKQRKTKKHKSTKSLIAFLNK